MLNCTQGRIDMDELLKPFDATDLKYTSEDETEYGLSIVSVIDNLDGRYDDNFNTIVKNFIQSGDEYKKDTDYGTIIINMNDDEIVIEISCNIEDCNEELDESLIPVEEYIEDEWDLQNGEMTHYMSTNELKDWFKNNSSDPVVNEYAGDFKKWFIDSIKNGYISRDEEDYNKYYWTESVNTLNESSNPKLGKKIKTLKGWKIYNGTDKDGFGMIRVFVPDEDHPEIGYEDMEFEYDQDKEGTDVGTYEFALNNAITHIKEINLTEGTKFKRISSYKEFDNGHVIHNDYKEMSDEEAENLAKQQSLKDPNNIFYVKYDDVMNPSSDYVWVNGKKYNSGNVKLQDDKPVIKAESKSPQKGDKVRMDYYASPIQGKTGKVTGRIGELCWVDWDDNTKSKEIKGYLTVISESKSLTEGGLYPTPLYDDAKDAFEEKLQEILNSDEISLEYDTHDAKVELVSSATRGEWFDTTIYGLTDLVEEYLVDGSLASNVESLSVNPYSNIVFNGREFINGITIESIDDSVSEDKLKAEAIRIGNEIADIVLNHYDELLDVLHEYEISDYVKYIDDDEFEKDDSVDYIDESLIPIEENDRCYADAIVDDAVRKITQLAPYGFSNYKTIDDLYKLAKEYCTAKCYTPKDIEKVVKELAKFYNINESLMSVKESNILDEEQEKDFNDIKTIIQSYLDSNLDDLGYVIEKMEDIVNKYKRIFGN